MKKAYNDNNFNNSNNDNNKYNSDKENNNGYGIIKIMIKKQTMIAITL